MTNSSEPTSLFLRACRRLPTNRPPIWLMRQAGRYMAEYREIRAKHSMLTVIGTPELAAEVTLQPIHKFGFDAAIIFADILPPLIGMGLGLDFVKGEGPQIDNPLRTNYAIDLLGTPPAEETMLAQTLAAIKLVKQELEPKGVSVSVVCPPDTETPGLDLEISMRPPETHAVAGSIKPVSAEVVAEAMVRGIDKKKNTIVIGALSKLYYRLKGIWPELFHVIVSSDVRKVQNH